MSARTPFALVVVAAAAGAVCGCGDCGRSSRESATQQTVPVLLDGEALAQVGVGVGQSVALAELLPATHRDLSRFALVRGVARDGREVLFAEPARDYAGDVIRVFREGEGPLSLGALRTPRPSPWPAVGNVERIELVSRAAAENATDQTERKQPLRLWVRGTEAVLAPEQLESLPATSGGSDNHRRAGWDLRDVLRLAEVVDYERVTVRAKDGEQTYGRATVDSGAVRLSYNRRGELRLTDVQATDERGGLRNVTSLEVH